MRAKEDMEIENFMQLMLAIKTPVNQDGLFGLRPYKSIREFHVDCNAFRYLTPSNLNELEK